MINRHIEPDNKKNGQNRIEYIDALRGFTMLLVVFSHVLLFSFHGEDVHSFNKLFMSFRMPLFFFISGFILYKKDTIWNAKQSIGFIWKKFKVQILATIIFLLFYSVCFDFRLESSFFSCTKLGYWFTFELFQYYLLYVVVRLLFDRCPKFCSDASLLLLVIVTQLISVKPCFLIPIDVYNFFSFTFLRYFIYFYFGTIVRRFFTLCAKFSDSSVLMGGGNHSLSIGFYFLFWLLQVPGIIVIRRLNGTWRNYYSLFFFPEECGFFYSK